MQRIRSPKFPVRFTLGSAQQLVRNQQVGGSRPLAGANISWFVPDTWRGQHIDLALRRVPTVKEDVGLPSAGARGARQVIEARGSFGGYTVRFETGMPREPLAPGVGPYLDTLVPPRAPELHAMEAEAARTNFPIIGPAAGHFCYLMTRLVGAKTVFELGSGFGYSTAWFARGVQENGGGVVNHVVRDAKLSARARKHLAALGLDHLVEFHVGEAVAALRGASGPFDLIFNDIDKAGYPASLQVITRQLRRGGLLLVDNLLWHGRVLDGADQTADTAGVRELTRLITTDPAWIASIVPIRDGILVAQRA